MTKALNPWICCQLGAREHFSIPRALHQSGQLLSLITDAWVSPQSLVAALPHPTFKSFRERFHRDLSTAKVHAFTPSLVRFELIQKLSRTGEWQRILERNRWFQHHGVNQLQEIAKKNQSFTELNKPLPILFAYSYAALDLLRFAKDQGWNTVLGQIDPGFTEERIVQKEYDRNSNYASSWQPAPPQYWENWQQECELADQIIVNSTWSAQGLHLAGIPPEKTRIIPLAYEIPTSSSNFERVYPSAFTPDRPLRVLFLGQIILRKGIIHLLQAAEKLQDQPIEFWLVGSQGIAISQFNLPKLRWLGAVPRSEVSYYYQNADVFLFPTFSDGFGLTQLESQAWKLPLIVSKYCGEVVKDRVNGFVLSEVNKNTIIEALLFCLKNPDRLEQWSQNSVDLNQFSLPSLNKCLQTL